MFVDPFAIAGVGLSLLEGATSASSDREQARLNMESIEKQMGLLSEQKTQLSSDYNTRRGFVVDKYGVQSDTMLSRLSNNMMDVMEGSREGGRQTGLAHSGTVQRSANIQSSRINQANKLGQKSLTIGMKSTMEDLSFSERRDVAAIDMERTRLEGEYKTQHAASDEKFLGLF